MIGYTRTLMSAGATVLVLAAGVGSALAQGTTEWRFFTYFPVNDKPAQLTGQFAEDVTKATGGKLKITVFAAGRTALQGARRGHAPWRAIRCRWVTSPWASRPATCPSSTSLSLPFLCTTYEQFDKALPAVACGR